MVLLSFKVCTASSTFAAREMAQKRTGAHGMPPAPVVFRLVNVNAPFSSFIGLASSYRVPKA